MWPTSWPRQALCCSVASGGTLAWAEAWPPPLPSAASDGSVAVRSDEPDQELSPHKAGINVTRNEDEFTVANKCSEEYYSITMKDIGVQSDPVDGFEVVWDERASAKEIKLVRQFATVFAGK